MKTTKRMLLGLALFLVLTSMAWVRINLMQPALIVFQPHIKKMAIIDRTLQKNDNKTKAEKVLTAEMLKQDEQALKRAIEGIVETCSPFNLYGMQPTTERFIGGGTKTSFPPALSWDEVSRLCNKYGSDALLSIEIFDTDFLVTNAVDVVAQVASGKPGYQVNGVAILNFGLRVYDPKTKTVADEYQISHRMNYDAGGASVRDAVNMVLEKVETMNRVAYESGSFYGERISPTYYSVTREFYNKPKKNNDLRIGVRKSMVADWTGAIESWKKALNAKPKVARRAAFNIAVAYEVLGDLQQAKEWARKAYVEYEEKRANEYYNILVDRIRQEEIIKRQVPNN
ncbi:MAG: tetratricopeptide repeat protein [Bacteroidales bacterium]|nr:tetratricopeptide repeat protein [Bacteroidales bacterium]